MVRPVKSAKIRTEFVYDAESRNWCFVVPSLGIVGGSETRESASEDVLEAIAFTLESENEAPAGNEVAFIPVTLGRWK